MFSVIYSDFVLFLKNFLWGLSGRINKENGCIVLKCEYTTKIIF